MDHYNQYTEATHSCLLHLPSTSSFLLQHYTQSAQCFFLTSYRECFVSFQTPFIIDCLYASYEKRTKIGCTLFYVTSLKHRNKLQREERPHVRCESCVKFAIPMKCLRICVHSFQIIDFMVLCRRVYMAVYLSLRRGVLRGRKLLRDAIYIMSFCVARSKYQRQGTAGGEVSARVEETRA